MRPPPTRFPWGACTCRMRFSFWLDCMTRLNPKVTACGGWSESRIMRSGTVHKAQGDFTVSIMRRSHRLAGVIAVAALLVSCVATTPLP